MIMTEELEFNPETLKVGDDVHHVDWAGAVGVIVRFGAYPNAVVRWDTTGRESTVNLYYLTPANV